MSIRSMQRLVLRSSLVLSIVALVAVPSVASAAVTVTMDGNKVTVTGDSKANRIDVVAFRGASNDRVEVTVRNGKATTTDCDPIDPKVARCAITGRAGVITVRAGAGNDEIKVSGKAPTRLEGGPGHDLLLGGSGPDVIFGGPGHDYLSGRRGADKLNGARGDDVLELSRGLDRLDGGTGRLDIVSVVNRPKLTLEGRRIRGAGIWTRADNVAMVMITGTRKADRVNARKGAIPIIAMMGAGPDVVTGTAKADLIDGGKGNDVLKGRGGRDFIAGGSGRDIIRAGAGRDDIDASDNRKDKLVHCGPGKKDGYYADASDPLVGCEVKLGDQSRLSGRRVLDAMAARRR